MYMFILCLEYLPKILFINNWRDVNEKLSAGVPDIPNYLESFYRTHYPHIDISDCPSYESLPRSL